MFDFDTNNTSRFIYFLLLFLLLASSLITHIKRDRLGTARNFLLWVSIIFLLITLYSYRYEMQTVKDRVVSTLFPSKAVMKNGAITFQASQDGHYYLWADINNTPIYFMLDTGATDIVLTQRDAKKIGIVPQRLDYTKIYHTANGTSYGAPVVISRFTLGELQLYNLHASVNAGKMQTSLLGMSFLNQLQGYEVKNGVLMLWP